MVAFTSLFSPLTNTLQVILHFHQIKAILYRLLQYPTDTFVMVSYKDMDRK